MKKNIFKMFIALIVTATFSIFQLQAQTTGSGTIGGTGCTASGTGGDCTDTYIGQAAGASTTGTNGYNSFFGDHAGFSNVSGLSNTLLGWEAGYSNTSSYNTLIGNTAGFYTTGMYNVIVGSAGYKNTGSGNTFLGYQAAQQNTTAGYNTALGFNAAYYNQTGTYNTCLGSYAGQGTNSYSYSDNNFIGYKAGYSTTTGSDNTGEGYEALYKTTNGTENTAIGSQALYNSNTEANTATGYYALNAVTTSGTNTANGYEALYQSTSAGNTAVGASALANNTTGANNTALGKDADIPSSTTYSDCTSLGYSAGSYLTGSDQIQLGGTSIGKIYAAVTVITSSDRRIKNNIQENVPGLSFINLLKPVTYHVDIHKENSILGYPTKTTIIPGVPIATTTTDSLGHQVVSYSPGTPTKVTSIDTSYWPTKYDGEKINHTGLIAQQVDSAAQKIGYDFSGVSKPNNENQIYGLSYAEFVVPLIKAVQELSKEVDSLKAAQTTGALQRTRNNNNDEPGDATSINNIELANNAVLYQNAPNPFGNGTTIKYFVPDNADAQIVFYDEFCF
jgi:hypothetical protein